MSKHALLYDGAGTLIGRLYCSQDDDLAKQEAPHVEVAADHAAVTKPGDWRVTLVGGKPQIGRR